MYIFFIFISLKKAPKKALQKKKRFVLVALQQHCSTVYVLYRFTWYCGIMKCEVRGTHSRLTSINDWSATAFF